MQAALRAEGVTAGYGPVPVVRDLAVRAESGHVVAILGPNGSGKSTFMKALTGQLRLGGGSVWVGDKEVTGLPAYQIARSGLGYVPQVANVFPSLTVVENLEMGAFTRSDGAGIAEDLERVYALFPRVKERRSQLAGTLSGGEQQMVAMGRALMSRPKLICMDEPSMGLSPLLVEQVFEIIQTINKLGTTIFVVEQNANMALSIATRGYVLQTGEVVLSGPAQDLLKNEMLRATYLGEMKTA